MAWANDAGLAPPIAGFEPADGEETHSPSSHDEGRRSTDGGHDDCAALRRPVRTGETARARRTPGTHSATRTTTSTALRRRRGATARRWSLPAIGRPV